MRVRTVEDIKGFCNEDKLFYFVGPQIRILKQKARICNQCIFTGSSVKIANRIAFVGVIIKSQNPIIKKLNQPHSRAALFKNEDEVELVGIESIIRDYNDYTEITGIFDNLEEAEQYLKDEVKKLKKELAKKKQEISKYTITLEQIATTFNIPINNLIIKGIYNDFY